jgi:tetratricopeptide (TPR) repeat protein
MDFLRKLFGSKPSPGASTPPAEGAPAPTDSDSPAPAAPIRVHDAYGREHHLTREQWRDTGLLPHLEKVRADPEALAAAVDHALREGFAAEALPFAAHLAATDPRPDRGLFLHALALLETKNLPEGEALLHRLVETQGDSAPVLALLARLQLARGERDPAAATAARALSLDPNHEGLLALLASLARETHGEPAEIAAYERAAALPDAWRARLWLARHALARRDLPAALKLYDEALERAPRPVPSDLLQHMSGDLGNHAHLPELLQLTAPYYDLSHHGLAVGAHLLKAYHDLGRLDAARNLLNRLYAQNRPDWKPRLAALEAELSQTRRSLDDPPSPQVRPEVTLLSVEGPVWLPPDSPAAELYPAKADDGLLVAFLGCSAELPRPKNPAAPDPAFAQLADAAGRLARSLPLFLVEQIEFGTPALARALVPWLTKPRPGFILGGTPWDDATSARHARSAVPDDPADYLVVTHLNCASANWTIEIRLLRTIDAARLGTATIPCSPADPAQALPALSRAVLDLLAAHAEIPGCASTIEASLPPPPATAPYLLRLEQLLAVRTAGIDPEKSPLQGERDILEGQLRLCLDHPDNLPVRLLFAHTLLAMRRARPEVLPEFRSRVDLLQNDKPLPEPSRSVSARLFALAFAT